MFHPRLGHIIRQLVVITHSSKKTPSIMYPTIKTKTPIIFSALAFGVQHNYRMPVEDNSHNFMRERVAANS